jgi:hypothetical protein
MARTFKYDVTLHTQALGGPSYGYDFATQTELGEMVGTDPVSATPEYIAIGNTASQNPNGEVVRIDTITVYATGIELFTADTAAPYETYDGQEITEIRIEHSGGTKTVTNAQWAGSSGVGYIYCWYPDTDQIWGAGDVGLTYSVEIDTNAPAAASFDAVEIIREDYAQASGTGTASVLLNSFAEDETMLVSVSAQDQLFNAFVCASSGGVQLRPLYGAQKMPAPYDAHQWWLARIEPGQSGNKTITVWADSNINPRQCPVAIRAWRLSGVARDAVIDRAAARGNNTESNLKRVDLSIQGDRRYQSGVSVAALFSACHVGSPETVVSPTGSNWTAETVDDYGGASSETGISVDTYLATGAFSGWQMQYALTNDTSYLMDVVALRSQATVDRALGATKIFAGNKAGIALPSGVRSATTTAIINNGRRWSRG